MIPATARPTSDCDFGSDSTTTRLAPNQLGRDLIMATPTVDKAAPKAIIAFGAARDYAGRPILNGTLHDALMARPDRHQPLAAVAQAATCIGREFGKWLLAQVSHLSEAELTAALDGLIKAELIYRRGVPPEATYLFRHALVRDAAYESLLKERRRAVHTRILTALEGDPDAAPEIRAVHAEAANLTNRAIDLWEAASKAAIARPAFDEAIAHLGRAIALITPQLDSGDAPPFERALALQVPLSMALLTRKGHAADETLEAFEQALEIADQIGETPLRYSILYGLWIGTGARGRHADALRSAQALVENTVNAPNTPPMVVANRVAGTSHWLTGNFAEAQRYLDVALANYDPVTHAGLANRFGQDIGGSIHMFQALNLLMLGQTRRAATHMDEAESLAMATGHINTICSTLITRAAFNLMSGYFPDTERCLDEVTPLAQEHNLALWLAILPLMVELVAAFKGDKTSIDKFRKAEEGPSAIKFKMYMPNNQVSLARLAFAMGLRKEAAELAMMAQEMIDETGETYALSDLHRVQAAIAMAGGDAEAAEERLAAALDIARRQGGKLYELRAAIDLARLWQGQGRVDEAIAVLRPIHASIANGDCPEDQATARDLLAALAG